MGKKKLKNTILLFILTVILSTIILICTNPTLVSGEILAIVFLPLLAMIIIYIPYHLPSILTSILLSAVILIQRHQIIIFMHIKSRDPMSYVILGFFLSITVILNYLMLIIGVFSKETKEKLIYKFIAIIIFPLILYLGLIFLPN